MNQYLDDSQKEAVKFGLSQKELAIIHGPPGTGKTTTVVELILQAVKQGLKVLATAPSNIAVDNMVERLANFKQRIVRIGHPARLLEHLQKYSLDAIVSVSEEKGLAKDVRTDMEKILKKLKKAKAGGEKAALREEMKSLQRELFQREKAATTEVLSRADVVLVTLTSAADDGPLKHLKADHFDLVVIDECSQALEAACWIGMLKGPKCVLAGDHLQLPPTIMSKEAAKNGLELSLMERILNTFAKDDDVDLVRMLTTQYRMHSDIMTWASEQLYEGRLTAHDSVAEHLLRDLGDVTQCENTDTSLLLIDTSGCDLYESDLPEEISKGNEGEADIVAAHVKELVESGVKTRDIAVISPYNLQIELLRLRLSHYLPDLEVKSVDGFQGREKEAVVISMVRSNKKGEVGFLAEKRRINVAVTRARRHLAVVCDTNTVCNNAFIKTLVDYMTDRGIVLSAHQYSEEISVTTNVATRFSDEPKKSSKFQGKPHKPKPQPPLATKEEKMEKYEKLLREFVANDNETSMAFPSSLNSHDRMAIHEVAGRLGLYHISVGEDKDRQIKISKVEFEDTHDKSNTTHTTEIGSSTTESLKDFVEIDSKVAQLSISESSNEDKTNEGTKAENRNLVDPYDDGHSSSSTTVSLDQDNVDQSPKDKDFNHLDKSIVGDDVQTVSEDGKAIVVDVSKVKLESQDNRDKKVPMDERKCPSCGKMINVTNFDLHQIHCARKQKQANDEKRNTTTVENSMSAAGARKKESKVKDQKPKDKKVSKVKKAQEVLKNIDGDDFDAMINSIKELDGKCAFKKCKTLTNILGSNCEFCTLRFCLTHIMPEIHGCGDAAKEMARRNVCREGVLYNGSGIPSHKPNATRRAQLERQMEKKMGEISQKRNRKKKDS